MGTKPFMFMNTNWDEKKKKEPKKGPIPSLIRSNIMNLVIVPDYTKFGKITKKELEWLDKPVAKGFEEVKMEWEDELARAIKKDAKFEDEWYQDHPLHKRPKKRPKKKK